jgi:DNA-binding LacI/PurR family transcriptional regulator
MAAEQRRSVTMADVAERAGVSRALVSIVFRNAPGASAATRQRVMTAAEELSYRPDARARLLGSSRSRTVGVVFGLHREFHAEMVERLYQCASGTGYELALGAVAPSRPEHTAVRALLDYRCEALVLVGPTLPISEIEELSTRVPVVVVARSLRTAEVDVVRSDDVRGARLAVEHLVGLGHRRIVHLDGGRGPGAAQRRQGYRQAMRRDGLAEEVRVVGGGIGAEDGERAAALLWSTAPSPTAVFAFNDHCAAGAIATARSRGLEVPGDLSVVGYDDSQVARLSTIALTTVAQDSDTIARVAMERATGWASGTLEERDELVVPPHLVVRRTTAPTSGADPETPV